MSEEKVIIVNENDEPLGVMPKLEAHKKGILHRAFSVFIFNKDGDLMLQKRALHKYHSPGLWTNTCCSHQREGESNIDAGLRRLEEEMGFITKLKEVSSFIYKVEFDNGLTENEYDYLLIGQYNGAPKINPLEVDAWKWMPLQDIKKDIVKQPQQYTEWFKIIFDKYYHHISDTKT